MPKLNYKHLFTNNTDEEFREFQIYLKLDKITAVEFATNVVKDYLKKCREHYGKIKCME